jgi:hypothetical protein
MWYENQASFSAQRQASEQFQRLHQQARQRQLWSALTGRRHRLLSLREVQKDKPVQVRSHAGLQVVPLAQICGSEGRCPDFDADFRPLQWHSQNRWISVAVARSLDVALPAVDLVQVNDRYFVRDGHHRISVAKMLGQLEIEAEVTVWRSAALPETASNQVGTQAQPRSTRQHLQSADRLLLNLGKLLITLGTKLQARYAPDTGTPALQGR